MKVYPKGAICTIKNTQEYFASFMGRECTILREERVRSDGEMVYEIEVQGEADTFYISHPSLKPKKFPPNVAFDSFLNKLLQPCDIDIKENV